MSLNPIDFNNLLYETAPECLDTNPAYFFADENDEDEPFGRSERAIAISVCKRCPIMNQCFMYAVDQEIEYGVYGGSVPQQREAYRLRVELSKND